MASRVQDIPLTRRLSDSGPEVSESDGVPGPDVLPVSRKKQAIVLISAFVATAITIGYNQTFGVFQEYYLSTSQDVLVPAPASQATPPTALLAFVGTLCYGLTWAGGIIVNPIMSRIEHGTWKGAAATPTTRLWRRRLLPLMTRKSITIFGVLLVAAGFILASFSTTIWELLLTQGFLVGLGMSFIYFPLLSPAPEYFTSHRATAMGFVSIPVYSIASLPVKLVLAGNRNANDFLVDHQILAGGGTGGLIFSPIIRALLSAVGGRWTLRIYAAINLVIGLPIAWAVPRSRFAGVPSANADEPERRNTHVSRELAARPTFIFSVIAAFLQVSLQ